jgi:hypothetical protein
VSELGIIFAIVLVGWIYATLWNIDKRPEALTKGDFVMMNIITCGLTLGAIGFGIAGAIS